MSKKNKKPIESWATASTERVGYWQSMFSGRPFTCGVLFANGEWWAFGEIAPGLERPVWRRTEAWLSDHLFSRTDALLDIGATLWSRKNTSEQALLMSQYPTRPRMTDYYLSRAREVERRVMDDVFKILTHPDENALLRSRYGNFQIRLDNPSPKKES